MWKIKDPVSGIVQTCVYLNEDERYPYGVVRHCLANLVVASPALPRKTLIKLQLLLPLEML